MELKKSIPNTLTCCNLLCGSIAVACSFRMEFQTAFLLILLAAVFDFLDGFSARLLKAYSAIGKELDSLADMVSFGLAPAFILWNVFQFFHRDPAFRPLPEWVYVLSLASSLLIGVFSALRLAKFNTDPRQSENFIGLATPACALLIGSLLYATKVYPEMERYLEARFYLLAILALGLSALLVSEIPMFSFKFKNFSFKDNSRRFLFLGIAALLGIATLVAGVNWSLWVAALFLIYILLNVLWSIFEKKEV